MLKIVVSLAHAAIAGVDGASVSVAGSGGFETAAATSVEIEDADKAQYASGHGPCVSATNGGETINVELAATVERWPEFAQKAVSVGYRSVLSTPLAVGGRSVGALNLYSRRTGRFVEAQERAAAVFARQAAVVLAGAGVVGAALHVQLSEAVVTRDVVGWATGILIAERSCTPDEAFDVLRRSSKESGRQLADVAREVVAATQARPGQDV